MGMRGFLFVVWFAAAACGFGLLARYDSRPGAAAPPVEKWPQATSIGETRGPRVLMFLHPKCPCSQASLEQLAQLLSRCGGQISTTIVAIGPARNPESWRSAAEARVAGSLTGVAVQMDPGGVEARRFGATTSGHVVIFDSEGRRLFSGGITGGRAMVGDNAGFDQALKALRRSRTASPAASPVYGCPILP